MTKKLCSLLLIFLLMAVCSTACKVALEDNPISKPAAESSTISAAEKKIRVFNPTPPNRMVDRVPLTPRLKTLEGKTIFLVDIGWGGKDAAPSIYREMKAWFAKNMPSVKIETRGIKGFYLQEQPELLKEISEKGDAAMFGIAG